MRCSGSCLHSYHNCIPSGVQLRQEKVLLSLRSAVAGPSTTVCGEVEVEEHTGCACGCDVTPGSCSARHVFLPAECRCSCSNSADRERCLMRGWYWHPDLCQCMCPNRPYPACSTSHVFDHEETCACVALSYRAFTVIELVVVVVSLGTLCTVLSLLQCYRKGLGLFKHRRETRFRSDSFRTKVRSLSERLDRTVVGRRREVSPQGEELVRLNTSNKPSPERSVSDVN